MLRPEPGQEVAPVLPGSMTGPGIVCKDSLQHCPTVTSTGTNYQQLTSVYTDSKHAVRLHQLIVRVRKVDPYHCYQFFLNTVAVLWGCLVRCRYRQNGP